MSCASPSGPGRPTVLRSAGRPRVLQNLPTGFSLNPIPTSFSSAPRRRLPYRTPSPPGCGARPSISREKPPSPIFPLCSPNAIYSSAMIPVRCTWLPRSAFPLSRCLVLPIRNEIAPSCARPMMPADDASSRRIMTVAEVAKYLSLHPFTIYRMARNSKIPAFRVGTDWRFHRDAIHKWMSDRQVKC